MAEMSSISHLSQSFMTLKGFDTLLGYDEKLLNVTSWTYKVFNAVLGLGFVRVLKEHEVL